MSSQLFITCGESLEPLLLEELQKLGIENTRLGFRGVFVPKTMENVYHVNYLSRLATRVLWPLAQFPCPNKDALYREAKKIPWLNYLNETKTFAIDANIKHPEIRHSLFGAQLVKDAICDHMREKMGARPSIDVKNPDVQLNLYIHNKKAILSFDTSGAPLYKRGWKESSGEASLPETLAAAILMRSSYSEREVFCDPFCGAGTFLIEAACIATDTPSGYFRKKWGFQHHPDFNAAEWEAFKSLHDQKRRPLRQHSIIGADQDPKAIEICKEHLAITGFDRDVLLTRCPIDKLSLPQSPTYILTDPPFGKRMHAPTQLYQDFGKFLRSGCPAAPWAFLLTSSFHLVRATGCSVLSEWPLFHGGLRVCLYQIKS